MSRRMTRLALAICFVAAPTFAIDADTAGLAALRQAAEGGDADAQYELGILYEFGYNFSDHRAAAYAWYNRAAEQGNALAAKRRDAIKAQLSAAEIERAPSFLKSSPVSTPAPVSAPADTDTATR